MLILASASPRRAELLRAARIAFETRAVDIDETALPDESPDAHVRRLAEEKARAVHAKRRDAVVLGADTVVVVDDQILGKPRDEEDAARMLRMLSGRAHDVLTGVAVIPPAGLKTGRSRDGRSQGLAVEVDRTRVWFSPLTDDEIAWYVATREPMDKAGAYAIQGFASRFIERIEGSYSNVVGLPVALVYRLLNAVS
jgi:septum formation protein